MSGVKLTKAQTDAIKHALGLDRAKASYRNRYHAPVGSPAADLWAGLVADGLATLVHVEGALALFTVTPAGRLALSTKTTGGE